MYGCLHINFYRNHTRETIEANTVLDQISNY